MTILKSLVAVSALAVISLPMSAAAQDMLSWEGQATDQPYTAPMGADGRTLTEDEIQQLIERSRAAGLDVSRDQADVQYLGGDDAPIETQVCCEPVQEEVTTETREEVMETYFDAITQREIIQPVERTIVQPIERQVLQPRTETVTETVRYEEDRLPVIVEEDPVPQVVETVTVDETVQTREDVTETYYDAIDRRDIIQPVERTVIVPVQRRIVRPRTETVTADTRYETNTLPTIVEEDPVPAVSETYIPQVTENRVEEVSEVFIDAVTQRDVYQPVERTIIQPIERRILQPRTETITRDTVYEEERLPVRVETDPAPQVTETVIEDVTERVVYEVQDVYIDQITRNVIQPVVVTNIQPIERRRLRGETETITEATRFEEERLPVIVEEAMIPETVVNYIPQVTENRVEEVSETYFEAVTRREIIQPVVRTVIQPVEIRRVRTQSETITQPVRYETQRAAPITINIGTAACACGGVY